MIDLDATRALADETEELPANIRDQLGGWVLPVGSSAVVLRPGGHLSIVHTESLDAWAKDVEQLRAVPARVRRDRGVARGAGEGRA